MLDIQQLLAPLHSKIRVHFLFLQIHYHWVPKVFQFTRSQEQIRPSLQWHYLSERPEKGEDIQQSVR